MRSYREIRDITSDTVTINVPKELVHQKVEIIFLPLDETVEEASTSEDEWPEGFFERFAGCLPDFPDIDYEGDYEKRESIE